VDCSDKDSGGLPFGPPLFLETIKLQGGSYRLLDLHQRRLERAWSARFGEPPGFLLEEHLPKPPGPGLFRARAVYPGPLGPPVATLHPYSFPSPSTLKLTEDPGISYSDKLLDRKAIDDLKASCGASDFILVRNGSLTDSSIANLVFEAEDGLFTPDECLLAGVKRESLLASGRVKACRIGPESLPRYSKAYFVNAMIDLEDDVSVLVADILPL
jgi:4-amino-4-deoxychorismate lyase